MPIPLDCTLLKVHSGPASNLSKTSFTPDFPYPGDKSSLYYSCKYLRSASYQSALRKLLISSAEQT